MSRPTLAVLTGLALALALNSASAAPNNDKQEQPGKSGKSANAQSQERGQGNGKSKPGYDDDGQYTDRRTPTIDSNRVRSILSNNRELIGPAQSLPPGIRKNLARGKPLPPGIAKRFNGNLQSQLPYYAGYEWQQAGTDVVLTEVATGVIYEVLQNVLD